MAIKEVIKVPDNKGSIPKCLLANNGVHSESVKKSTMETSLKKFMASSDRTRMIPAVMAIVIKALDNKLFSIIASFNFRIDKYPLYGKTRALPGPGIFLKEKCYLFLIFLNKSLKLFFLNFISFSRQRYISYIF